MAFGRFAGGNGTLASPYLIEDAFDLNMIRFYPAKNFKLVRDINLSEPPFNKGWDPIENFNGYLDGNFHRICNLYINSTKEYVGFFGNINFARYRKVENLSIENAEVHGNKVAAILAGKVTFIERNVNYTTSDAFVGFSGIHIDGKVYGNKIGGIIGNLDNLYNDNYYTYMYLMKSCYADIELHPENQNCSAGLVCGVDYKTTYNNNRRYYINNSIFFGKVVQPENYTYKSENCIDRYVVPGGSMNPMIAVFTKCYSNQIDGEWNNVPSGITLVDDISKVRYSTYTDINNDKVFKQNSSNIGVVDVAEENYWRFSYNDSPDLFFMYTNNYVIKIKDKYYTYDKDENIFVEIMFDNLLDIDNIKSKKIDDFTCIDNSAYIKLLNEYKDEDLTDKVFVYTVKESNVKIKKDTVNVAMKKDSLIVPSERKDIYKTSYSFIDDNSEFVFINNRYDENIKRGDDT